MPETIRPRLAHLLLLLLVCAAAVGFGVTAATGPQAAAHTTVLDTSDHTEPTARTYLAAQP
jgi:hypothetical protein